MDRTKKTITMRIPDPFDGSARERFAHMGLLDSSGSFRIKHMVIFTNIFTGLFYSDLCDFHEEVEDRLTVFEMFRTLCDRGDYHHMYLLMSIQYDYMGKPLPDPVWWLAGDSEAIEAFMVIFMKGFERLMTKGGFLEPEGVGTC